MDRKLAIFDLDGTLIDTSMGILESAEYAIDKLGYPKLTQDQMLSFIGPPIIVSYMKYYECGEEEASKLTETFRECYSAGAMLHARPYDGIFELCETLRDEGFRIAAATNKPARFTVPLLNHFGFDRWIDIIHCADENGNRKKADLIRECIEDAAADKCFMIGDTEIDAKGADEAGVPFILVTYGFGHPEEIAKYPVIGAAADTKEVLEIIRNAL